MADTVGIEALTSTEPNFEQLASFDADIVVATELAVGEAGREVLERLGTLVVVPESDPEAQMLALGDAVDRDDEAEALVADLHQATDDGRAEISHDPPTVSVATVYPGPSVAAWVDGPVDAGGVDGAQGGRVYLSEEQIDVLDADTMVTMQSDAAEGEQEAVASMEGNPLWADLPSVAAGRVITIDRLGYPGIAGRIRLVDDLIGALGSVDQ